MLPTVNANEGRTSWRTRAILWIGGLAVLALPAVYLSRATAVQAEDPPKAAPVEDPVDSVPDAEKPSAEDGKSKPAAAADNDPFGDGSPKGQVDKQDNPFGSGEDEAPTSQAPVQQARPAPKAADPFEAPARMPYSNANRMAEPSVEFLPEPSQSEKLIVAALDRKVTFDFTEMPLVTVVEFLEDLLEEKVPIELDHRALEDAGIGGDTPVTLNVKDVKLRTALKLLLREKDLTYLISDDVMLFTSQDKAETELVTRTYPVGDLLEVVTEARSAPKAQRAGSGMFQVGDPGTPTAKAAPTAEPSVPADSQSPAKKPQGGGMAKSSTPAGGMPKEHKQNPYDTLIEVITSTVKPQSWDEVGGPGSISEVPVARSLVISQTRDVHDEVLELLRALRAAKRASNAKDGE